MMNKIFILILFVCFILGVICITVNLVILNYQVPKTKIIYRYLPKSFEQKQREQPFASEIFKTMFTQQSPWLDSSMDYDRRKMEAINKYFISQI